MVKSITGEIKLPVLEEKVGASNSAQLEPWCALIGPERGEFPDVTAVDQPEPVIVQPGAPASKPLFKLKLLAPLLQVIPVGGVIVV